MKDEYDFSNAKQGGFFRLRARLVPPARLQPGLIAWRAAETFGTFARRATSLLSRLPALAARGLILLYRVTFSAFAGRWCRHAPSCSQFADEAIDRHGLWAGGWMSLARICRCRPGGTDGFDPPPTRLPPTASPYRPWRYGTWRGPLRCDPVEKP